MLSSNSNRQNTERFNFTFINEVSMSFVEVSVSNCVFLKLMVLVTGNVEAVSNVYMKANKK